MPSAKAKQLDDRLQRAKEVFGGVRSALPEQEWSDERCAALTCRVLCLGHRSLEALYSFLYENELDAHPLRTLLANVTDPQPNAVTTFSLPLSFGQYLRDACPCRPADFLLVCSFIRDMFEHCDLSRDDQHNLEHHSASSYSPALATTQSSAPASVVQSVEPICTSSASVAGGTLPSADKAQRCSTSRKRTRYDTKQLERLNYRRRNLRKIADEMIWQGAETFFSAFLEK
jgi:hypothetical protein